MPTPPSNVVEFLAQISGQTREEVARASDTYPYAITPFLLRRMRDGSYSVEAARQFVPDARELLIVDGFTPDPAGESNIRATRSILRAYDNRLLILMTHQCLVYCRFCFRKDFVGFSNSIITQEDLDAALEYLSEHTEIEDVLLSGGDPLAVPNRRLIPFLAKLVDLPHIKAIRLDSRAVSVAPSRIDDELVTFLSSSDRFWYYAHMNHPDDVDHPEVVSAIRRLQAARVPVLNQAVILAGVNDDPQVMLRLMRLCYYNRVIPYNLYMLDHVHGAAHFGVSYEQMKRIFSTLAELPGPAQPVLVYVDGSDHKHRAIYSEALDVDAFLARSETHSMATTSKITRGIPSE